MADLTITTYAELKTAIASWLHRTDLTDQIPAFIALTEAKLQRVLNTGDQEATATLSLTTSGTVALPTGFNVQRRLRYLASGGVYQDIDFVDIFPSGYDGVTQAPPVVAVVIGSNLSIRPKPDQTYTALLDYYAKFTPLSTSNTTNWILTSHPDIYLYGSLLQSAPYVGSDNRISIWSDAFQAGVEELEREDWEKRFSQNQARSDIIGMMRPYRFNINTGAS